MSVFVALLLLSGNVEPNPGPPLSNNAITLGCFNARSVQSKAALIHDLISDNNIDILALQETWLPPDVHPAIKCDIAPPGYVVQHVHRPSVAGRPSRGGGVAVVFRDHYKARPIDLHLQPTAFELQSLVISSTTPPILLLNIYQPQAEETSSIAMV